MENEKVANISAIDVDALVKQNVALRAAGKAIADVLSMIITTNICGGSPNPSTLTVAQQHVATWCDLTQTRAFAQWSNGNATP